MIYLFHYLKLQSFYKLIFYFNFCFLPSIQLLAFEKTIIEQVSAPEETRVADLNGDGYLDLITAHLWQDSLSVYLQQRDKSFKLAQQISVKNLDDKAFIMNFEVGDFNGDDLIDLVVFNKRKKIYLYRGFGNGSFDSGHIMTFAKVSDHLVKKWQDKSEADRPVDQLISLSNYITAGMLDIQVFYQKQSDEEKIISFHTERKRINLGKILMKNKLLDVKVEIEDFELGDVNGDGFLDLVIASANKDFAMLFLAKDQFDFEFTQLLSTYSGPCLVKAMDIDQDGKSEILFGHYKSPHSLLYSFSNGKLDLQQSLVTGVYPTAFNYDTTSSSLATIDYYTGTLKFFEYWKKTFLNSIPIHIKKYAKRGRNLAVADLNKDGYVDFVITDYKDDQLIVLYGR